MRSFRSLTQTYIPVTDNARFNEIDEHYKRNGPYWIDISNGEATRDKRRSLPQRRKNQRLKTIFPPEVLDLVRDMNGSLPPKVRYSGGRFLKGPLKGQEVPGLPQFFEKSSGRLKYCYMDLVKKPEVSPKPRAVFRRTCNMSPAEPFTNKSWLRGSGLRVVTTITTNVWTPDKYPDWAGPPGFLADKDPTWIPKGIHVPWIRKTGNMGEGALARTDYEKDEFLGELVGELAPIGYYTDGWAADLSRDDLSPDRKEATWCQVYPRYMGNW
ncbi:histone-lysine n-methyltransferase NSD2, partial [Fusarium coicis]